MPMHIKIKREPQPSDVLSVMAWVMSFDPLSPNILVPGGQISGLSFISPYPPGIIQAYSKGLTEAPRFNPNYPDGHPLFSGRTFYGAGKVFPVIGPVAVGGVVSPYSNVTVQQCVGVLCTVQISAVGPQDPYGTVYTYTWSGAFGTVPGAQPVLDLPVGTTPVTLNVSDIYGAVLTTATMDIVVVDPSAALPGDSEHDESESDDDDEEDSDTEDEESDSSEEDDSDDEENDDGD